MTVRLFGSSQAMTLDLAALSQQVQQVPNLRHCRVVLYLVAVLLTLALWTKRPGPNR